MTGHLLVSVGNSLILSTQ